MFPALNISGFSPSACRELARAAMAAYLRPSEIEAMACANGGADFFKFIQCAETNTECFIAQRGRDVVIAFRGTASLADWVTDAKCRMEPFKAGAKCKVHRGFLAAFASVKSRIRSEVENLEWCGATQRFWITGHSLGGALAILCASYLRRYGFNIAGVYTFGGPRVGNRSFAAAYDSVLREKTFRLVNEEDIVPRIPGLLAGYRHCGTEIFLESFGSVLVDPSWLAKLVSDLWGFAKSFDPVLPPATALNAVKDHNVSAYIERLNS